MPLFPRLSSVLRQLPAGWLRPRPGSPAEQYLTHEKIRASLGYFGNQVRFLPWIDGSVVDETTEMREAYRQMLREPAIKAAFFKKILSVAQLDLQVHPASDSPADQEVADFVHDALMGCRGGVRRIVYSIVTGASMDGYSVCEKVWQVQDRGRWKGRVTLKALKAKDSRWLDLIGDTYRNVTHVRDLRTSYSYAAENFVIYAHLPMFETPLGMSDFRAAYRAYWIMDAAWKLRSILMERYTLPFLMGSYPQARKDLRGPIEAALENARAQGWVSLPEGAKIEAIQLATAGDDAFKSTIQDLTAEMVLAIEFATLQTLQGTPGSERGNSQVHQDSSQLLTGFMAAEVGDTISDQLVPALVDINIAGAAYPRVTLSSVDDGSLLQSLQVDEGLAQLGLPLSKKATYEKYSRQKPSDPMDTLTAPQNPAAGGSGGDSMGGLQPPKPPTPPTMPTKPQTFDDDLDPSDDRLDNDVPEQAALGVRPGPFQGATPTGVTPASATATQAGHQIGLSDQKQGTGDREQGTGKDQGPADKQVAGKASDADQAEKLLDRAKQLGVQVLSEITRSAVERLVNSRNPLATTRLYNADETHKLQQALTRIIAPADLLGRARVRLRMRHSQQLAKHADKTALFKYTDDEPTDFSILRFDEQESAERRTSAPKVPDAALSPMAPTEALAYFKRLVPELNVTPQRFGPALERDAFTMSAATDQRMLDRVHQILSDKIATGVNVRSTKEIDALLDEAGVTVANPNYSSMVVRTNYMDAMNTAFTKEMQDPDVADWFPVWQWSGIETDGRQRPSHRVHNRKYFSNKTSFAEVRDSVKGSYDGFNDRCTGKPVDKITWAAKLRSGAEISKFADAVSIDPQGGLDMGPKIKPQEFCGGSGGKPGPCPENQAAKPALDLDAKHRSIAEATKHIAATAWSGVRAKVGRQYQRLEQRYGPRYAKAILGAGLAGLPIPLPGSSILTAAPVLAVAELHRRLHPVAAHADPADAGESTQVNWDGLLAAARDFLASAYQAAGAKFPDGVEDAQILGQLKAFLGEQAPRPAAARPA